MPHVNITADRYGQPAQVRRIRQFYRGVKAVGIQVQNNAVYIPLPLLNENLRSHYNPSRTR